MGEVLDELNRIKAGLDRKRLLWHIIWGIVFVIIGNLLAQGFDMELLIPGVIGTVLYAIWATNMWLGMYSRGSLLFRVAGVSLALVVIELVILMLRALWGVVF